MAKKKIGAGTWAIFIIFGFIAAGVIARACGEGGLSPSTPTKTTSQAKTQEHKLAIINNGAPVDRNHPSVNRFRVVLDRLDREFNELDREGISDVIVVCWKDLKENGFNYTLLWVAEELNRANPDGAGSIVTFAESAAMWLTLVESR